MTDGGTRTVMGFVRSKVLTLNGAITTTGVLALIIGFFVQTLAGWLVCGGIAVVAAGYLLLVGGVPGAGPAKDAASSRVPRADAQMKTLLFDDFQGHDQHYVVKDLSGERTVVPSSRAAEPVGMQGNAERPRELSIPDFFEFDTAEPLSEVEPRSEFHALLDKVLLVLKDVLFAHTVAFFWANRDKRQMVVESMATDSKAFMSGKRYDFGHDLVTQVAESGKPQVIGRMSPATQEEMLHYYEAADPVRSVIAVPVFYRSGESGILPVGVIAADSKAEDAFGQETLAILGRFTKLVSSLVKSYTDKYDLLLESELLTSIRRLQDRVKSEPHEDGVLTTLVDELRRLLSWEYLTVTMYAEQTHGWVVQRVVHKGNPDYITPGRMIDSTNSIVGEVIRSNRTEIVHDLSDREQPRFGPGEPGGKRGTFLCVPISSLNRCYGALALEAANASAFSGSEVEVVYRLVENTASLLEVLYMNDVVRNHVSVDHVTGALMRRHFLQAVEREVRRADDFGTDLALLSLTVDGLDEHAARYGKDAPEVLLAEVAGVIRGNLRAYDVFGRQDDERFGMLLVNTTGTDAALWAEKVRKAIASHVITLGDTSLSVTVSIGVCGLVDGMRPEDLWSGAGQVVDNAVDGGGNIVRVF